jgi:hypothetical protein
VLFEAPNGVQNESELLASRLTNTTRPVTPLETLLPGPGMVPPDLQAFAHFYFWDYSLTSQIGVPKD